MPLHVRNAYGSLARAQAARHTHAVRSRLLDLVDLLLGWSLEPDLPPGVGCVLVLR